MSAADIEVDPGYTGEEHPEIFASPPPPSHPEEQLKPGQLTRPLLEQYYREGFVILKDFFTREELDPCRDAIEKEVDILAEKLHKAGKIKNLHREARLEERLTLLEKEYPGTNIILHKLGRLPEAFRSLWSNERLLNLVEQLVGPEIVGHPNWNLRPKTPQNEATTVPWHQDSAYLDNESYKVFIPTAWIPFLDTDRENGCMELAARAHRKGKIATHQCCSGGTWYIMLEEEEMEKTLDVDLEKDITLCPVPYGGLLLFNNVIPHRSLPNMSDKVRWTVDLRWQRADLPIGLFGLKDGVLLRSRDPNHKIDWESFDNVDRNQQQRKYCEEAGMIEASEDPELDTTVPGPWMKKWKIVHANRHTTSYMEGAEGWQKN